MDLLLKEFASKEQTTLVKFKSDVNMESKGRATRGKVRVQ